MEESQGNSGNNLETTPQFMNSIADECNDLKKAYDDCFNAWFSEKFLKGDRNLSKCDALLHLYTGCVKNAMKAKSIDINEVDKEHLGTDNERKKPS
ncbi:TP53-regulated inhibitor of apoptosis 1-B [Orchesella cincta]|uniref:TP53-regulated inhibitor of apoptosis 1-B n=1 Tax=Orchesella cincta TaxID=48709 RepID=A0A1D2MYN1_ORCCI|nr:TP53-regulated inhibitor of apoptosis 1-B [Orchesella cincta]